MFETKCLIVSLAKVVNLAETKEEIYDTLVDMAKTESIDLPPYSGKDKQ